jgi:hypothetical protein
VHWTRRISPRRAETLDKGHGHLERRRLSASTTLNESVNLPHVAQVCRIERQITELKSGKHGRETVFTITRLAPAQADPQRLLPPNRGQWAIENRSHSVRDMAFDGDRSRIRVANGPATMTCLRNFAIALARLHGFTNIASALRASAHQPRLGPPTRALRRPPACADRSARPHGPKSAQATPVGSAIRDSTRPARTFPAIQPLDPRYTLPNRGDFDEAVAHGLRRAT